MPKGQKKGGKGGNWNFRDVPRELMRRANIAAAVQETSVKQILIKLMEAHLQELEKKGLLPKGRV